MRVAGSGALRPTREPTFGPAELVLAPLLVPLTRTAYVQDFCPSARLPLKVSTFDCGFAPVLLAFRQVVAYCATGATWSPLGSVSANENPLFAPSSLVLVTVKVSVVDPHRSISFAPKAWLSWG